MDRITAKEAREYVNKSNIIIEEVYDAIKSHAECGYTLYEAIFHFDVDIEIENRLVSYIKEDGFEIKKKQSYPLREDIRSVYQISW